MVSTTISLFIKEQTEAVLNEFCSGLSIIRREVHLYMLFLVIGISVQASRIEKMQSPKVKDLMDFDIVHRTTRVYHIPMIWTSSVVKDVSNNSDNIDNAANITNGRQDYHLDVQIRLGCGILANK